jgi:hypothetical protein
MHFTNLSKHHLYSSSPSFARSAQPKITVCQWWFKPANKTSGISYLKVLKKKKDKYIKEEY